MYAAGARPRTRRSGLIAKDLDPQAIVIFGASGDLTKRKLLPAFYHLFLRGLLPKGFAIVGYARTEWSDEEFRAHAHDGIQEFSPHAPGGEVWHDFSGHLSYLAGEFANEGEMDHLVQYLENIDKQFGTGGGRFFYAATPPAVYPDIVRRLGDTGLHADA
jgi:glucose-6-phosphate 1-dehydrogenase